MGYQTSISADRDVEWSDTKRKSGWMVRLYRFIVRSMRVCLGGGALVDRNGSTGQWQSKIRVPYKTGPEVSDAALYTDDSDDNEKATRLPPFNVKVNWPVSNDKWIQTSHEFQTLTGITRYRLWRSSGLIFNYTLEFTSTEPCKYTFIDEEGDYYDKNVGSSGTYGIDYNSDAPNIVAVKGS